VTEDQNRAKRAEYRAANKATLAAQDRAYYEANKEVVKARSRAWHKANRERAAARARAWREANAEKIAQRGRVYYETNKERLAVQGRAWREANKEKAADHLRAWREANPEQNSAHSRNRKARVRNAPGSHTAEDILALVEKQENRCANPHCAVTFAGRRKYQIDHMMPLSRGGSNDPANLQLLCAPCNRSKGTQTMEEWQERLAA
jgi:5-methylcytosine-specific restriction endonuclease McrA